MGRLVAFVLALTLSWIGNAFDTSHALWGEVLNQYRTDNGLVAYAPLKAAMAANPKHPLRTYLTHLSAVSAPSFDSWSRDEQMAFLINAYNAFTVQWVLHHYPVTSIKKTVGWFASPWKQEFFSLLDGKITHLDAIEHQWLREKFQDARIHAAVNCASISCPVLQAKPFTSKQLNAQLDGAFTQFLLDPSRNRYEAETGVLYLSKIFDWFESDFQRSFGGVKKAIERFGPETARVALTKKGTLRYLDYDWGLNDSPSLPASVARKKP